MSTNTETAILEELRAIRELLTTQPPATEAPRKLRPVDVEATYRIKAKTLAEWRSSGTGPPFERAGRRILYDREQLEAWLESRRASSTWEANQKD